MTKVPKEILWDYREPPEDLLWRLQRIADFFPMFGRDRETVLLLHTHLEALKVDDATRALIKAYHAAWEAKE